MASAALHTMTRSFLAGSVLAVLVITSSHAVVKALPTSRKEPAFVAEPQGRGTVGLIVSSILTLVLCVWTAMHVDVLDRPLPLRRLLNKIVWVLVGLLAPEIIIATAYGEWVRARKLLHLLQLPTSAELTRPVVAATNTITAPTGINIPKNASQTSEKSQTSSVWGRLTGVLRGLFNKIVLGEEEVTGLGMEGSLFAIMGGFMLCPLYPSKEHGVPLLGQHVQYLLEKKLLLPTDFSILKAEVADKGKANMVGKLLVCCQALWITVACLCRKISGLPVPLLEVHVVVHVLCTVIVYCFWWRKPQDVGLHLTLGGVDKGRSAFIYTAGFDDLELTVSKILPDITNVAELSEKNTGWTPPTCYVPGYGVQTLQLPSKAPFRIDDLCHGFTLDAHGEWDYSPSLIGIFKEAAEEIRRRRFADYIEVHPNDNNSLKICGIDASQIPVHQPNVKIVANTFVECGDAIWALYWLGIGYSSFHSTAWNYEFPTDIEKWLWRASCIIVASLGLVVYSHRFVMQTLNLEVLLEWIGGLTFPGSSFFGKFFRFLWRVLRWSLGIVYISARVYLVLESFISIRSLPEGSYRSVPWTDLWPHF